jgi:polysaccharide transporter, PST family
MQARLVKNIGLLYLLQLASFALPLVTVPYLTRTLGLDRYGLLAFAAALIAYFVVLTDFGFSITGTRAVAAARGDPRELGALLAGITFLRLLLMSVGVAVLLVLICTSRRFAAEAWVYLASALSMLGTALFPGWLLQGLESMRVLVVATVAGRLFSTAMIFVLVHGPTDVAVAAALQGSAQLVALGIVMPPLLAHVPFTHWRLDIGRLPGLFGESLSAFISTAAISLYTSSIAFVLGLLASPAAVGAYSAATKIAAAINSVFWGPVSQAVYPRLAALRSTGDFAAADRLLGRLVRITLPAAAATTLILWLLAEPIVRIVLGAGMESAAPVLRILSGVPALLTASNFLGVLVLYVHGEFAAVSRLQAAIACLSIAWLVPLVALHSAEGAAWSALITETVITGGFMYLCRTRGLVGWTRTISS